MTTAPPSLKELVMNYFKQKGYAITENPSFDGFSGVTHAFDLLIQQSQEKRLVWFRDWNRTVGVNMIIKMDNASEDVAIPKPIMISHQFSGHARAYANRRGVILLTKGEIIKRSH
ncbi:MAG TPA: restriction endonuclease [Candidatus Krumholzibacteriaceae bacterium]|jgi:hypothetical protein|nr:restriction endonuclease [Candidatus Krumholzibacteriaceae bacterium]